MPNIVRKNPSRFYLRPTAPVWPMRFARTGSLFFAVPVRSDRYLEFLVKELKPFIDRNFSTRPDRSNTFIAGSSMGGLISLYAICEYPETFGGAACLSTHWPVLYSTENNPLPDALRRYMKKTPARSGHTPHLFRLRNRNPRQALRTRPAQGRQGDAGCRIPGCKLDDTKIPRRRPQRKKLEQTPGAAPGIFTARKLNTTG